MKRRISALLMAAVMLLCLCSCGKAPATPTAPTTTTTTAEPTIDLTIDMLTTAPTVDPSATPVAATLDGVSLSEYTLVYGADASDYTLRAVVYLYNEILRRTGAQLNITADTEAAVAHEIVVGETNRPISAALDADTEGVQFALLAQDGHIAMEGDYFVIAAAAYYFIATYVPAANTAATLPDTVQVLDPIQEKPNNFILLIGDGMGAVHTSLPVNLVGSELADYTDGEQLFYGSMLPYAGYAHTNSLDNTTDSAASATALASGYKTKNGYVGRDSEGKDLLTLTELAGSLGMSTAVMSTEVQTGATPAGFSAHAADRDETDVILESQQSLQETYGTIIDGDHDVYTDYSVYRLTEQIAAHLNTLSQNEKGFFMMYEEAYIDKHSHEMDVENAARAVLRFNQAIARFMEFAFYHPDTFLLITADHETGGLWQADGEYDFLNGGHTSRDVPVFAYGVGAEVFHGQSVENVQIPKTISKMWGHQLATDTDSEYPPLN